MPATSPVTSAVQYFRDEFEAKLGGPVTLSTPMAGGAYVPKPAEVAS